MRNILALVLALVAAVSAPASAADLDVLCAGAVRATVSALAADYERATGDHVHFTFGTVGGLRDLLASGTHADVVLLSTAGLDALQTSGTLLAGSRANLGRTGVGIAVRANGPVPDVSTEAALRNALLAAKVVAYPDPAQGATSGRVVEAAFAKLGIADAMAARAVKPNGGFVAQLLVDGKADLVLQNVSEIVPVAGVVLAGPLPPTLQTFTTYGAAVLAASSAPATARAFIAALATPAAQARWRSAGFELAAP